MPRLSPTLLAMILTLILACRTDPPPPAETPQASDTPDATRAPSEPTQSDDPIVGRTGDAEVRMSDVDTALRRLAVFSPDPKARALPSEVIKAPHFQQRTVVGLIDTRLTRQLAATRKIEVTQAQIDACIARDDKLVRLTKDPALLASFGLNTDDLKTICADRTLHSLLTEALAPPPDDDTLWEAWKHQQERIELDFVAIPNTPASKTIGDFVASRGPEIEAFYKANPKIFEVPASRRVRIIEKTLPKDADRDTIRKAREALDALRMRAISGEPFAALARAHSDHGTARSGGLLGFVVRRQRPEAFGAKVGDVTEPTRGATGAFILSIEEEIPAHTQPLNPSTRREIAARILRAKSPNQAPLASATEIAKAWRAVPGNPSGTTPQLDAAIKAALVRRGRTFPFRTQDGDDLFIPGIGKAPLIMRAAARLTAEAPISDPIFHEGTLYVLALKRQGIATRTGFEAAKASFGPDWHKRRRQTAVSEALDVIKRKEGVFVDAKPIQDKYGVLKKPTGP